MYLWRPHLSTMRTYQLFGDVATFFKFLDFEKNLKLGLSPVGKMYIVCAFLMNIHICMSGSMTSSYCNIDPLTLQEYLA